MNNDTENLRQTNFSFRLENDILIHIPNFIKANHQIVVPHTYRTSILKLCHDDSGHFNKKKTLDKIRSRWWWSALRKDTSMYIQDCKTCQ